MEITCPLSGRPAHDVTPGERSIATGWSIVATPGSDPIDVFNASRSARENLKILRGGATGATWPPTLLDGGGGGGGILGRIMRPMRVAPSGVSNAVCDSELRMPDVSRKRLWRLPRERDLCDSLVVSWKWRGWAIGDVARSLRLRRRLQFRSNSGSTVGPITVNQINVNSLSLPIQFLI